MTTIKPRQVVPAQVQQDQALPPGEHIRPNDPFTLLFWHQWEFVAELAAWLPQLNEVRHTVGTAGIGRDANPTPALAGYQAMGAIVILPTDRRLGEFMHYLGEFAVRGGGRFYCLRNVAVVVLGTGAAVLDPDRDWEWRLRRQVYESGIVPAMPPQLLGEYLHQAKMRLADWRRLADQGKLAEAGLERRKAEAERQMAAWVAAYERQFPGVLDQEGEHEERVLRAAPAGTQAAPTEDELAAARGSKGVDALLRARGVAPAPAATTAPARPVRLAPAAAPAEPTGDTPANPVAVFVALSTREQEAALATGAYDQHLGGLYRAEAKADPAVPQSGRDRSTTLTLLRSRAQAAGLDVAWEG